jgi:hypothetical protein
MPPQTNEVFTDRWLDPFAEPRDFANQWDMSALWVEPQPPPDEKESDTEPSSE